MILIYLVLLLWPTVVFHKDIKFEPATFTQEWIKSICSVSIIFIVLEYQKFIFESIRKKHAGRQSLELLLINPLKDLIRQFNGLGTNEGEPVDQVILAWSNFYRGVDKMNANALNIQFVNSKLLDLKKQYGLTGINEEVESWVVRRDRRAQIPGIVSQLESLIRDLETEKDKLI